MLSIVSIKFARIVLTIVIDATFVAKGFKAKRIWHLCLKELIRSFLKIGLIKDYIVCCAHLFTLIRF